MADFGAVNEAQIGNHRSHCQVGFATVVDIVLTLLANVDSALRRLPYRLRLH